MPSDPSGTGREALEVAPLEREVAIVRGAERHGDVGRLVALDALARLDHVHGQRRGEAHQEEDDADRCDTRARTRGVDGRRQRGHAQHNRILSVRSSMTARVPFAERGGRLRGVLDLATGCYPAFLFGGSPGDLLPAFHFHDVTREWLEPRLQFLVDNGYRTAVCDDIARIVVDRRPPEPRTVALTFDDAWESVHSVALPLMKQYGLRAILFAIPARIADAPGDSPFVTWTQLRDIHASGVFDVQSHTRSHAMIFSGDEIVDFVRPGFEAEPLLNRPIAAMNGHVSAISPDALGTPLYVRRSRMSDARRYVADESTADRCRRHSPPMAARPSSRGPPGGASSRQWPLARTARSRATRRVRGDSRRAGERTRAAEPEARHRHGEARRDALGHQRRVDARGAGGHRARDRIRGAAAAPPGDSCRRRSLSADAAERQVPHVSAGPRPAVLLDGRLMAVESRPTPFPSMSRSRSSRTTDAKRCPRRSTRWRPPAVRRSASRWSMWRAPTARRLARARAASACACAGWIATTGPNPGRNVGLTEARQPLVLLMDADVRAAGDAVSACATRCARTPRQGRQPDRRASAAAGSDPVRRRRAALYLRSGEPLGRPHARRARPVAAGHRRGARVRAADRSSGRARGRALRRALLHGQRRRRLHSPDEDRRPPVARVPRRSCCTARGRARDWLFYYQIRNRWHFILKNYELRTISRTAAGAGGSRAAAIRDSQRERATLGTYVRAMAA